ncbi:hypothetical protein [Pinisolibacter aquiterrae]|uniref:hypothetical protein n=1 Tax=Pinisolibacter aquiterrae TaxID=2815579 RepID=UPI001C3E499B|nr:hypothetical protein [Pinisolibacter aquiterrae]MBV5262501.1 hypothetical protein [Pinisolibacter aquiterrae]MCC8235864.1 hypothetical protein [Pinisolibacter aquiterrae]
MNRIDERTVRSADDRVAMFLEACFAAVAAAWERFEAGYRAPLVLVPVRSTRAARACAIGAERWRGRAGDTPERLRR